MENGSEKGNEDDWQCEIASIGICLSQKAID